MSTNQQNHRQALPSSLAKEVRYQIQGLSRADLSEYTYEQTKSEYINAKTDFSVYDPAGTLVLNGRGFGDRNFFWTPSADPRIADA